LESNAFTEKKIREEKCQHILVTSALLREQEAIKLPEIFCPVIRPFSPNCQLIKSVSCT
jgi:hypothetical protein